MIRDERGRLSFVVFLEGFPRFWGGSRKEARERYCAGRGQLLSEPTEIRIEAADHDLHCPAVAWHAEPLFLDDAILDRLLNNAHPITLEGALMRRLYDSTKSHSTT